MSAIRTGQKAKPNLGAAILPSAEKTVKAACVTRPELAALLQVSLRTVDRMIAAEEIPVRRVRGKAVRFLRSDVDAYLCEPHLPSKGGAQ